MGKKLTNEEASVVMFAAGLTPLIEYPGALKPWLCRHDACGRKVTPRRDSIVSGRGGCKFCAGLDVEDPSAVMIAAGLTPLADYPGNQVPWLCRHDECGREVTPRRRDIVFGQGGCKFCATNGRTIGTGTVGPDGIGRLDLANGKGVTLVDLIDFPAVVETCWCANSSGYAYTSYSVSLAQTIVDRAGIVLVGDETIDHINRNRLDNRRDNLRAASKSLQISNQGPPTIGALGR